MDNLVLSDNFENLVETSTLVWYKTFAYLLITRFTWKAGLKLIKIIINFLRSGKLLWLLEKNIGGGVSKVRDDRYVEWDVGKSLIHRCKESIRMGYDSIPSYWRCQKTI